MCTRSCTKLGKFTGPTWQMGLAQAQIGSTRPGLDTNLARSVFALMVLSRPREILGLVTFREDRPPPMDENFASNRIVIIIKPECKVCISTCPHGLAAGRRQLMCKAVPYTRKHITTSSRDHTRKRQTAQIFCSYQTYQASMSPSRGQMGGAHGARRLEPPPPTLSGPLLITTCNSRKTWIKSQ